MGSSASKTAQAARSAARRYPSKAGPATSIPKPTNASRAPPPPPQQQTPPMPQASGSRNAAINEDASDPDFARSLRSIGPVQPNPTLSPSSIFPSTGQPNANQRSGPDPRQNPALFVLERRAKLQEQADREAIETGTRGHEGRQFLEMYLIKQILQTRDQAGKKPEEIERAMGLKAGVVARLGSAGTVELPSEMGRAQKQVEIV